jgi:hypothetical protein
VWKTRHSLSRKSLLLTRTSPFIFAMISPLGHSNFVLHNRSRRSPRDSAYPGNTVLYMYMYDSSSRPVPPDIYISIIAGSEFPAAQDTNRSDQAQWYSAYSVDRRVDKPHRVDHGISHPALAENEAWKAKYACTWACMHA